MNEEVPQTVMALTYYHGGGWRAMHCFRWFHTAERTTEGIEAMHVLRRGLVKRLDGRDAVGKAKFVESLFSVVA